MCACSSPTKRKGKKTEKERGEERREEGAALADCNMALHDLEHEDTKKD